MDRHEKVADGVFRTTYSNGECIVVNYNDTPATVGGVEIPSMSAKLVLAEAKNSNKDQVQ